MGMFPPTIGKELKKVYEAVRKETGEAICLHMTPNSTDCPNCHSNPDGESTNIYDESFVTPVEIYDNTITPTSFNRGRCPVCKGKGVLEQDVEKRITAIVRWNPSGAGDSKGDMDITAAGIEGFNNVLIKIPKCYYNDVRDCVKAVISNIDCKLLVPPVLRHVGKVDVVAVAFFTSIDPGHSSNG